ncbi:MAG: hypothetical protein GKR91_06130 [Pseudomonadales bacterium]|nr:hypothetical protein [Pseudomonadales bacterium]
MKFYSVLMALLIFLLPSTQMAAQEQRVLTLYFSGTGMDQNMWQESTSAFGQAETVASLHYNQIVGENQFKGIVDGFSGLEMAVPDWDNNFAAAIGQLRPAFTDVSCEQCITLNLVGFSRGAVSTMHMAHQLISDAANVSLAEKIAKINIMVFDPVPGDLTLNDEHFNLPAQVANFIGFYSEDERTSFFSPVFPVAIRASGFPQTNLHFYSVPGSHETMVGSRRSDGHAHENLPLIEEAGDEDSLAYLSELLELTTRTILGSEAWGQVRYTERITPEIAGLDQIEIQFNTGMEATYTTDNRDLYAGMREFSFLDPSNIISPTEAWSDGFFLSGRCRSEVSRFFSANNNPRCVYVGPFTGSLLGIPNKSLDQIEALSPLNATDGSGEYKLWNLIESFYLPN